MIYKKKKYKKGKWFKHDTKKLKKYDIVEETDKALKKLYKKEGW